MLSWLVSAYLQNCYICTLIILPFNACYHACYGPYSPHASQVGQQRGDAMRLNKLTMKQYGFIRFSPGMNRDKWIADAKAQGYTVLIVDDGVELWR